MPNIVAAGRRRCVHECACGAVLICGDAEHCTVPHREPWVCDACELQALDAYVTELETAKEETCEPQQSHR